MHKLFDKKGNSIKNSPFENIKEYLEDRRFTTIINKNKYIEFNKNPIFNPSINQLLEYSTETLKIIFDLIPFDLKLMKWTDLYTGSNLWAITISKLLGVNVSSIDIEKGSYGTFYEDEKVVFIQLDLNKDSVPLNINACFLRSSISLNALKKIVELNSNIELFVIIPEGINDNSGYHFNNEVAFLNEYFNFVCKQDIYCDLTLKGSQSTKIVFNQYVPVIISHGRKDK